ncbi:MAG: bifunctional UDP-N-acetylglucosamine diphosphorylase/glucosamine-1-phosphate N-acetyltransferase GlmU, partial [Candidatus Eisenbacteria bacterium]
MEPAMTRFHHPDTTALVLAAGQGTRMHSDLAKVLHEMSGSPLLAHVLAALEQLGMGRSLVVIGHQADRVRAAFTDADVEWVLQSEQRGTGHAVLMAGPMLEDFEGTLLVVCGDTPLLRATTLESLLARHRQEQAAVTVLTTHVPDPSGYGRIVRDAHGAIAAIVEEREATPEQMRIDEINSAVYAFHYPALEQVLSRLTAHNAQGEYYLTDTVRLLIADGRKANAVVAPDYRELLGINTL